jgi:TonB family protein
MRTHRAPGAGGACLILVLGACAPAAPPLPPPAPPALQPAAAPDLSSPPVAPSPAAASEPPFARDELRARLEALRHPPGYADEVQGILLRRMKTLRRCFERSVRRNPSLGGRLQLHFTIGREGTVTEASARIGTPDAELEACLTATVRGWTFPPPPGGRPVTFSLPGD